MWKQIVDFSSAKNTQPLHIVHQYSIAILHAETCEDVLTEHRQDRQYLRSEELDEPGYWSSLCFHGIRSILIAPRCRYSESRLAIARSKMSSLGIVTFTLQSFLHHPDTLVALQVPHVRLCDPMEASDGGRTGTHAGKTCHLIMDDPTAPCICFGGTLAGRPYTR